MGHLPVDELPQLVVEVLHLPSDVEQELRGIAGESRVMAFS